MLTNPPLVAAILGARLNSNSNHDNEDNNSNNGANDNENNGANDNKNNNNNNAGPVESEPLMNEVRLAQERGKYLLFSMFGLA